MTERLTNKNSAPAHIWQALQDNKDVAKRLLDDLILIEVNNQPELRLGLNYSV